MESGDAGEGGVEGGVEFGAGEVGAEAVVGAVAEGEVGFGLGAVQIEVVAVGPYGVVEVGDGSGADQGPAQVPPVEQVDRIPVRGGSVQAERGTAVLVASAELIRGRPLIAPSIPTIHLVLSKERCS